MFNPEFLIEFVNNWNGPSPYGCSCKFYKLDENWGVKLYESRSIRDNAFRRQRIAAEAGLAPNALICFDMPNGWQFGYISQLAKPLAEGDNYYNVNYMKVGEEVIKTYPEIDKEIRRVYRGLREAAVYMEDTHYANFGWIDGKLVCIDFSH